MNIIVLTVSVLLTIVLEIANIRWPASYFDLFAVFGISAWILLPYLVFALLNERARRSKRKSIVVLIGTVITSATGLIMIFIGATGILQQPDPLIWAAVPAYQGIGCMLTHVVTRAVN